MRPWQMLKVTPGKEPSLCRRLPLATASSKSFQKRKPSCLCLYELRVPSAGQLPSGFCCGPSASACTDRDMKVILFARARDRDFIKAKGGDERFSQISFEEIHAGPLQYGGPGARIGCSGRRGHLFWWTVMSMLGIMCGRARRSSRTVISKGRRLSRRFRFTPVCPVLVLLTSWRIS
jgi:hypothetical protein